MTTLGALMLRANRISILVLVVVAVMAAYLGSDAPWAQSAAALSGTVTSQAEGKMEGVVVTARRDGANFDVSVVSDAQGRYTFPRTHLAAGKYAIKIRA